MTEPTDVEGLVKRLDDARYFIQDSLTNGHPSPGVAGNLMGARDEIDRVMAALSALSTQLEEARRDARARSQPGYGECALASADAEPSGAWRPIESAPRDGTHVLFHWRSGFMTVGFWSRDDAWQSYPGTRYGAPTHWQPLPYPPPALLKEPSHG